MTMRKELRKYSSIGNKAGILLLCKKVLTGQMEDLSSIGASCSFINGVELNFKCGIIAFEDIKLISVSDGKCIANSILYSTQKESVFLEHLCRYCMNALIQMDLIQIEHLKYNELKDAFQIPMYAFKLECAVYRNMLITFGAIVQEGTLFTINDKFEEDFTLYISNKRKITQDQLLKNLEQDRIVGEKGEEFVLKFEKKRCPFTNKQLKRIKQISVVDVSAGYDILSFENELSEAKRYIEVKTYCGDVHFYWSANEIEAARLRNASYYLYLVDYNKINIEGYTPLMIQNPYVNIKNLAVWDMQPSSYVITTGMQESELKSIFPPDIQIEVADETADDSIQSSIIRLYSDEDKAEDGKYIPLYSIRAACGKFLYNEDAEILGWVNAEEYNLPNGKNYFIVQAKGHSMEPRIQDGDYCLFEHGTSFYENDIILAEIPNKDADYGGSFTIKKYTRKKSLIDEVYQHSLITLEPLNNEFEPIAFDYDSGQDLKMVGVFKKTIL